MLMANRPEDRSARRARRGTRGEPSDAAWNFALSIHRTTRDPSRLALVVLCVAALVVSHLYRFPLLGEDVIGLEESSSVMVVPGDWRQWNNEVVRPSEEATEAPANNEINVWGSIEDSATLSNDDPTREINDARGSNESAHELSVEPKWIDHLKSLPDFPKIIHIIWPDKNILNTTFEMIQHGMGNLQRLNPDWKFVVHDYDDINDTVQNFNLSGLPGSTRADLASAHIVEKTDAFRLMRVYETGGLYVDIDRVANVRLSDAIPDLAVTRMVIPTYYDINFAQDLFGSSPGNELLRNVLKRQCHKRAWFVRRKGWIKSSDHLDLVDTFSSSLEFDLFGRQLKGEKESVWDEARNVLASHSSGTVVTKKDMWCDGLLIEEWDGCKNVRREPLYDAYNLTPWAEEVDALFK